MNDSDYRRLTEIGWKRPLTPEEQAQLKAWLARHPEDGPSWEQEARITRMLRDLPEAPLSSNFTAQVMQALDHGFKTSTSHPVTPAWRGLIRAWLPRAALAGLVAVLGGTFYWNDHQQRQSQLTQSLSMAGTLATFPAPAALKDFEAINELTAISPALVDFELLAALE